MNDNEAIETIMRDVEDELIISNIGLTSRMLYKTKDRGGNFYMLGSFGLVSSIALGLALCQKRKVFALDGDGSMLTNLGSLVTVANQKPRNLYIFLLDNGVYLSTRSLPTYTSRGITDLGKMGGASGISYREVEKEEELTEAVCYCKGNEGPCLIHTITEPGFEQPIIPVKAQEIKDRFMRVLVPRRKWPRRGQ